MTLTVGDIGTNRDNMRIETMALLRVAHKSRKHDFIVYSVLMRRLEMLALPQEVHNRIRHMIIDILEV